MNQLHTPRDAKRPRTASTWSLLALILLGVCLVAATSQPVPQGKLEVVPTAIELQSARDFQRIAARLVEPSGITRDITSDVQITAADPALLAASANKLTPIADGSTTVNIAAADQTVSVPVTIKQAKADRPVSFRLDVMPALTRAGCNNGACHGSARGQDGFHLSLFGYDPTGDYFRITREMPGRRINLAQPAKSLLLEKALGVVPHTGGALIDDKSALYKTILEWIEAGAPDDPADLPHVTHLDVGPSDIVLLGQGAQQRIVVRAHYSDGSDRDVTDLAVLMTNNDNAATISGDGIITAKSPGEALLMARFDAYTVATQAIILPADAPADMPAQPANNYIDELVNAKLRKLRIEPSPICTDEVFLRRVHLDIVGQLPTADARAAFLADTSADKRAKLVDELLTRKEFVEIWVMKWAERLQIRSTPQVSYKATLLYFNWLKEQIAGGVPIDRIVRSLLSGSGGTFTNPATNFYEVERDTLKLAENVAQTFMGARMQCAQCHNHPFDRWTMDDYYSFAAFFAQVGRKRGSDPREMIIFDKRGGEVKHPVGGRVMQPKFLGGEQPDVKAGDRREALANWLTSADNPMFARNVANFIWDHYLGQGIVDPVDDVRISNPASNPQLLDALANRLVESDYDLRTLVRDICTSRTYQRATTPTATNANDTRNFTRAAVRRIRAEVLLDCISQVTGSPHKFTGLPLGARAVQIADGNTSNYFLTTFGRATRATVCTCEVVMEPNLSQALHLINGDTTGHSIRDGKLITNLLKAGQTPQQVIDHLFITCLTREPTQAERDAIAKDLAEADDPAPVLEDVFWALLNSKEFMFNH